MSRGSRREDLRSRRIQPHAPAPRRRGRGTGARPRRPSRPRSLRRIPRQASATRARRAALRETTRGPSASRTARTRRRRGARPSPSDDPPRLRVDRHPTVAHPAAERDAPIGSELHRERRRCADCDEHRTTCDSRLLHELERQPPADTENVRGEREHALARTPSRRPCPSRCVVPRPRARRAARPRRRKAPSRGAPRSRRKRAATREVDREAPRPRPAPPRAKLSTRGALTCTASIAPFPHTPHEDDV